METCHMCGGVLASDDQKFCGECGAWLGDHPPNTSPTDLHGFLQWDEYTYIRAAMEGEADPPQDDVFTERIENRVINVLDALYNLEQWDEIDHHTAVADAIEDSDSGEFGAMYTNLVALVQLLTTFASNHRAHRRDGTFERPR